MRASNRATAIPEEEVASTIAAFAVLAIFFPMTCERGRTNRRAATYV